MKKNYFYYIEEINKLNDLEKILYELVMFQESKQFYIYQEEAERDNDSKIKNDKTNRSISVLFLQKGTL